ncbi:MAG TPA: RNA polymerase [Cytophagales bacterium]|nr:RNA polymerase [Cytophagales bacterium]HAA19071.1 RNA polymerase [Cytophagales bacterium]
MTERRDLADLIVQHHTEAYRWARQCCRFREDTAKDVLQTAYMKVLEGKARYGGKGTEKAWLFGVIRYTALEHWRSEREYAPLEAVMELAAPEDPGPSDARYYEQTIRQLPERQAEVLLLVFYHQLTLKEAAEVMQLEPGTVSTHYARGKAALRTLLKKSEITEGGMI